MADSRGIVVAWSAGVSAASGTLAALFVNGNALLERTLFILFLCIAVVAFVILVGAGLQGCISWWWKRRTRIVPRDEHSADGGPEGRLTGRSGWHEYLQLVREIMPRNGLLDRGAELAEMAAFCSGQEPYWWWRADAWAGKSALMSWFVLHPPPGVVIVSFFVTRVESQDNSTAFTAAVVRQVQELLGQDLPAHAAAGQGASYRRLLSHAAQHFHERGKRLILAVDGLDEDNGSELGLPSIASLLPKQCDNELRVIVAGRPHPKIPFDVPTDHPLRDTGNAHVLSTSVHAKVIRDAAERELHALLVGEPADTDLLGLLTAAQGGLTVQDLEVLSGLAPFEISQTLRRVTGRTFTSRAGDWETSDAAEPVYLLAHETLQAESANAFGERLSGYRDRLNAWAESYRSAGWPVGTPAYLLLGYFRMLQSIGDADRLIACANDTERHNRMLDLSGGDVAAHAEITAAQEVILAQPDPDPCAMAHLAIHRARLDERNARIPEGLPAIWTALGQLGRGESLARSLTTPLRRAEALARVARALTAAGLRQRAKQVANDAEANARSEDHPDLESGRGDIVLTLAGAGFHDQAERVARSITKPHGQAVALAAVAEALAAADMQRRAEQVCDEAETVARSIRVPSVRADALAQIVEMMQVLGRPDRAEQIASEADAAARSSTDEGPGYRAYTMARIAAMLAATGMKKRAIQLATDAESAIIKTEPDDDQTLEQVGLALLAADLTDQAERIARSITSPTKPPELPGALVAVGRHEQAVMLARSITDPLRHAQALENVAQKLTGLRPSPPSRGVVAG